MQTSDVDIMHAIGSMYALRTTRGPSQAGHGQAEFCTMMRKGVDGLQQVTLPQHLE